MYKHCIVFLITLLETMSSLYWYHIVNESSKKFVIYPWHLNPPRESTPGKQLDQEVQFNSIQFIYQLRALDGQLENCK